MHSGPGEYRRDQKYIKVNIQSIQGVVVSTILVNIYHNHSSNIGIFVIYVILLKKLRVDFLKGGG